MASRPFECTVSWCSQRFNTLKEMAKHKVDDPAHFYCKRCDVDCNDWEDLTNHKVGAMAPYIEGKLRSKDLVPKHITCEFCGEDFKSWGGRRRHREQMHPAEQDVECPGCRTKFVRASHFVAHLEFGECTKISQNNFEGQVRKKHMLSQIMQDPEGFVEKNEQTGLLPSSKEATGLITYDSEMAAQDEGGVALLDRDNTDTKNCDFSILQPEKHGLIDDPVPCTRDTAETWPRLPGHASHKLANAISVMSINSPAALSRSCTKIGQDSARKAYDESFPSLTSSSHLNNYSSVHKDNSGAWYDVGTSKVMCPYTKSAFLTHSQKQATTYDGQEFTTSGEDNVFNLNLWDPKSLGYQVERFHNTSIRKYICPLPNCNGIFDIASDIQEHISQEHTRRNYDCIGCHKRFAYATSLVAHAESAGKCKVQQTEAFRKLLDEISGGFLKSHSVHQPKLYRPEQSLMRRGQPMNGIMSMKYMAKMPESL